MGLVTSKVRIGLAARALTFLVSTPVTECYLHAQVCHTDVVSNPASRGWANSQSVSGDLVGDGSIVLFQSSASNLIVPDSNVYDVYWRNRVSGTLVRVNVSSSGIQANGQSTPVALSTDGNVALFVSRASNLVGNDANSAEDSFIRDLTTGITERVSLTETGGEVVGPTDYADMSGDARRVVFETQAPGVVANDTNGSSDVFLRDRWLSSTVRISVGPGGVQGNDDSFQPSISRDGHWVAYATGATNIVSPDSNPWSDIVVVDLLTMNIRRASQTAGGVQANGPCERPCISADGRFVAFTTTANNLYANDLPGEDIYVWDAQTGNLQPASVTSGGAGGNSDSRDAAISWDGRFVSFETFSTNLIAGGPSGNKVVLHDMLFGSNRLVGVNDLGA